MPAKPQWLLQISSIVECLSALEAPVIDRAICERLFGLRRRRAIDLMQRFGGYRSGNTVLIDRVTLISRLRQIEAAPETLMERSRKDRLSEHLERIHQHRSAAKVHISVPPDVHDRKLADLPEGIRFEAGRLTVDFSGPEQLLSQLYEVAQAAANDFDRFVKVLETGL